MSFEKTYIGKGKQVENKNIVRVTLNFNELEKFTYEYEGQRYLTFELSQLRQADKYGKTHTAYISEKAEATTAPEPPATPADGSLPWE